MTAQIIGLAFLGVGLLVGVALGYAMRDATSRACACPLPADVDGGRHRVPDLGDVLSHRPGREAGRP